MQRVINTIALTAAAVVLMAGLWQDWSLMTTLKRMLVGYLGFFVVGSLMALAIKLVPVFEKAPDTEEPSGEEPPARRRVMT